jgi:hypothetical protein
MGWSSSLYDASMAGLASRKNCRLRAHRLPPTKWFI